MAQSRSVRKPNVKFDMHYPLTTPEIFVDGIDQNLQGFPLSKIIFYQTARLGNESDGANVPQRVAALRLVIPTATLLNFCKDTLSSYASGATDYEANAKRSVERIKKALEGVPVIAKDADEQVLEQKEGSPPKPATPPRRSKSAT